MGLFDRSKDSAPATAHDAVSDSQAPEPYGDTSGSHSVVAATHKFPSQITGFSNWFNKKTFYLGPSAEEKLFKAHQQSGGWHGTEPTIILNDGPGDEDPVLATAWGISLYQQFEVRMPQYKPAGGDGSANFDAKNGGAFIVRVEPILTKQNPSGYRFEIEVGSGKDTRRETFEWRNSRGDDVKELGGRWSYGWKLMWLSGPNGTPGASHGSTASDGKEVEAIFALGASWDLSKSFHFALHGTGLTGKFGEPWEVAAFMTGMQICYLHYRTTTSTGPKAES